MQSDAHMLLFPSSSKDEPSADGEVVVGIFLGNCMPTSVAFHLLILCVILLRKIVIVLMEQAGTS